MTDVRLTALNPVDSQVYPVACNTSGELLVADGGPDLTVTGDLTVEGKSRFEDFIEFPGSISTPGTAAAIYCPVDNNLAFSTASQERLRINSAGRVGIGSISPSSLLTLRQTTASHQIFEISRPNSDSAALFLGNDASNNAVISANNSSILFGKDFAGTFTERMRSNDSGLDVTGTGNFTGNVTAPNITSLNALVDELQTKMSLILRQIDISAETP